MQMKYSYHPDGTLPPEYSLIVLVFGSNQSGRHGKGMAKIAREKYGAIYGQGIGFAGATYAIPTKDWNINVLPLANIQIYVDLFKKFAEINPGLTFFVTRVGCGLAGYTDNQIAPLFKGSPANCNFAEQWKEYLE